MKYRLLLSTAVFGLGAMNAIAEPTTTTDVQSNKYTAGNAPAVSTEDIINILIQEKLIDKEKLVEILGKAKRQTQNDFDGAVETISNDKKNDPSIAKDGIVRVPYVPQYIRDDIREKVRMELREQVVGDIMSQAEKQRWGVPGTTPHWTHKIKWTGDIRLRAESTLFDDKNNNISSRVAYKDYNGINDRGGFGSNLLEDGLNINDDRTRLRARLRLGMKAKITTGIEAEARLVTGKSSDPVSNNQTLGNYGDSFAISFDRVNLKYKRFEGDYELVGGRFKNPFLHTDLVWDSDYQFDGVSGIYWPRHGYNWEEEDIQFDPFIIAGIFPIDEIDEEPKDKWLYGLQLGFNYQWLNQDTLSFGVAYYHYENISGKLNDPQGFETDYTAPNFLQKGNTLFDIKNELDGSENLLALLAEYRLINATLVYDIAKFSPHHVILTLDVVQNLALDKGDMEARAGGAASVFNTAGNRVEERELGVQAGVTFGWPTVSERGQWQGSLFFKSLEREATLDAFTDSDFHLGGTDGKGFIVNAKYGLSENTVFQFKWLSSEAVDGNDLGVDIYQFDINAKF
ncbi:MAG: putative porin [Pseudomonadales bacterium]|nr:putative porin [Pseudomonadales bacterium]